MSGVPIGWASQVSSEGREEGRTDIAGHCGPFSPRLSTALDLGRSGAACYVVAHHLAQSYGILNGVGILFRFGQEAVLVFFLLSGFVVFANERDRAHSPSGYLLRRLRRIYTVMLFAMAVSTLVAWDNGTLRASFDIRSFLGTMMNVQDIGALKPGVLVDPYLGNLPLWSLSYEMAFYLAFPFVLMCWERVPSLTNHMVGSIACICYAWYTIRPNHFTLVSSYFLVWWTGAMAAQAYLAGRKTIGGIGTSLAWLIVLCVVAGIFVYIIGYRGIGVYPFLPFRHFVVAAVILGVFFGPFGALLSSISLRARKPAVALASISYALYAVHYPLLVQWTRVRQGAMTIAIALVVVLVLAWLAERQLMRLIPAAPKD